MSPWENSLKTRIPIAITIGTQQRSFLAEGTVRRGLLSSHPSLTWGSSCRLGESSISECSVGVAGMPSLSLESLSSFYLAHVFNSLSLAGLWWWHSSWLCCVCTFLVHLCESSALYCLFVCGIAFCPVEILKHALNQLCLCSNCVFCWRLASDLQDVIS